MIDQTSKYLFCAVCGFGLAMMIKATFRDLDWDLEWETLITGALAVGAARMTVTAMLETDRRQQARHEHLARLNLREDIRLARSAGYYAMQLANLAVTAPQEPTEIVAQPLPPDATALDFLDPGPLIYPEVDQYLFHLAAWLSGVISRLALVEGSDAKVLFPAEARETLRQAKGLATSLEGQRHVLRKKLTDLNYPLAGSVQEIAGLVRGLVVYLEDIASQLADLSNEYESGYLTQART